MRLTFKLTLAKVIYKPAGKAGEYAKWACNLYNGCTHKCNYCYLRKGVLSHSCGGETPVLKKTLKDLDTAILTFKKELSERTETIQAEGGIFFSFTTDPMQHETFDATMACAKFAIRNDVDITILTKAAWWEVDPFIKEHPNRFTIGFTLTGHDEMEPGAEPNSQRIEKMKELHSLGVKTFASCEPIIDFGSTLEMISQAAPYCNEFRIGLLSGVGADKYYKKSDCIKFADAVKTLQTSYGFSIYWKDSIRKYMGDGSYILNAETK